MEGRKEVILFTMGFTRKSAEDFFNILKRNGVKKVIDVRRNNGGQLAGFAQGRDLPYLLYHLANGCKYEHRIDWAPTEEIRKHSDKWQEYLPMFKELMNQNDIGHDVDFESLDHVCLLCSEVTAEHCHRGILANRFHTMYPQLRVVHL